MSLDDPFLVAKNEIVESMDKMRISYEKWTEYRNQLEEKEDKESKIDFDSKTLELRNQIRSLEWDVEDLEETYGMYDSYPQKMKLSEDELSNREKFIQQTKDEIRQIKEEVFDSKYNVKEKGVLDNLFSSPIGYYSITFDGSSSNRYKRLDDGTEESNNNHSLKSNGGDTTIHMDAGIPSNDLRLAREIEQMMEEESNGPNNQLINNFGYSSGEYNQIYQPTLNVIDSKYDSPFKRLIRNFHWSNNDRTKYGLASFFICATLMFIFILF